MECICERCGYKTVDMSNLRKHLRRKKPCKPILNDIDINDLLLKTYSKDQKQSKQETSYLLEKIDNLEKEIVKIKNNNKNVANIGSITNNSLNINLKDFGFENISHIENDKEFMTRCFIEKDIMGLIESIHCDIKHPENHNVRIKNLNKEFMETFVNGRWIVSDQEETLDELLNKGYRVMNLFSYRNKKQIIDECEDGKSEYEELRDWLEDLYNDNKLRKPLKRKLLILFMNNKTLILEKEDDGTELISL